MQMAIHIRQVERSLNLPGLDGGYARGDAFEQLIQALGDTISSEATISTLENSKDDTDHLWHLHLDHMSERAMEELHKRKLLKNIKSCKMNFCKYCILEK